MKKTFICDVDSVLLDMDFVLKMALARRYSLAGSGAWARLDQGHPRHWEIEEAYGIPRAQLDSIWDDVWADPCKPLHGADDFLRGLRGVGVRIIACSSRRPGAAEDALKRDIAPLDGLLDGVMAVDGGKKKAGAIKKAGIVPSWFLDDRAENVFNFKDGWPDCHVMLFDQPWNQSLDLDPPYSRIRSYQNCVNIVRGEA